LAEVSNGRANLHLHTIFSDGELPPAEVVRAHADAGFTVIALTDHDTLAGIDAIGGLDGHGVRLIAGVELSIEDEPRRGLVDAHLLGYGFALNHRRLRNRLHQASEAREAQKRETVRQMAAAGFDVEWEAVRSRARGNVGKPHIVAAIEAAQPGVSREELYAVVWGRPFRKEERSVDVYVRKLRAKLEAALPDQTFIHTHFGFGYRFHREPSQVFHKQATRR